MRRLVATLALCCSGTLSTTVARAQSCLGYPAFPTGPINVSTNVAIGSDFWGLGGDVNYGSRKSGPFGSVGAGTVHFVTDPKESRFTYGATGGWEKYNKDQLIWCPYAVVGGNRGSEVDFGTRGPQRTTQSYYGLGLGVGFELERKGPLSFNPFITAREVAYRSNISFAATDTLVKESGATFAFGLGVRFNEAVQVTPSFSGSTFRGSNLVFDLRVSLALQFKK